MLEIELKKKQKKTRNLLMTCTLPKYGGDDKRIQMPLYKSTFNYWVKLHVLSETRRYFLCVITFFI